jgi:F-type H+/Na+-transporting ATPase subunit alpha
MKIPGKLIAASKLSREEIDGICTKFQKMLGQEIDFVIDIDKTIIGGYKVIVGERLYDLSIESYLERIKATAQDKSGPQFDQYIESLDLETESVQNLQAQKDLLDEFKNQVDTFNEKFDISHIGIVESSADGVVNVKGLSNCKYGELLRFEGDVYGIVMNLELDRIGAVLLSGSVAVSEGSVVHHTGEVVRVPVGEVLFGRVINPIGEPIDGAGKIEAKKFRAIESQSPPIMDRRGVYQPIQTGIMAVDSIIPIGRGQRELIIGDRKTGKTAIAADAIINQKGKNVYCVYVAIGQKASSVAEMVEKLRVNGAMDYTVVVTSTASDTAAMQYLSPYAGCAVAEDLMYDGKDVLVVYDDLSKHAIAYRTMSLLLRRPPGREAYPGDVFYLHSRLLERAAKLSDKLGGGSMTALPIIETMEGDISAYIPTNVISITDGQLFLESELFNAGQRPAINVGLSVSRVGGAAQIKAMRKVAGQLRIVLAQYRELAVFAQFASDLDKSTRESLDNGVRLMSTLIQPQYQPYPVEEQVVILHMAVNKVLLEVPLKKVRDFNENYLAYVKAMHADILKSIADTGDITKEQMDTLLETAISYRTQYLSKLEPEEKE